MQDQLKLYKQLRQLQAPNQEGEFGISESKAVITWTAELIAEIVSTIRGKNARQTKLNVLDIIFRFGDDLTGLLSIINKFQQIVSEASDIDQAEAVELMDWVAIETKRAFSKKGLVVDDETTQKVLGVVNWLADGANILTSF